MKKVLKVMDSTGDSSVSFDATVNDQAQSEARVFFDKLMAKGSAVFAVNRGPGAEDKRVRNFNELEAENVVVPRMAGG